LVLFAEVESLFRRDEIGAYAKRDLADIIKDASSLPPSDKQTVKTALVNKISTLQDSDVAARGLASTVGGAVAGGATSAVVGNLLNRKRSRDYSSIRGQNLDSRCRNREPVPP
jgi:hypothetical protein